MQKNAKTPLSVVYDNKSALEQMHYTLLLSIMHHHGLGVLLDPTKRGTSFRRLLYKTLLATDMSVHFDFMSSFQASLSEAPLDPLKRQVLVCQALIKCADISNPVGDLNYKSLFSTDASLGPSPLRFKTVGERING